MKYIYYCSGALLIAAAQPAYAQSAMPMDHAQMDHSNMDMGGMEIGDNAPTQERVPCPPDTNGQPVMGDCTVRMLAYDYATGSGTSRLPGNEGQMKGAHLPLGDGWMAMAHGYVSAQFTYHNGPRGDDKAYVTSMAMLMAHKQTDWGKIELKSMFSLEPAISARGYPNLFATGETAGGAPLVDRQHPHDLFMELAAKVDVNVTDNTSVFIYGGPVGEPALGPSAFMHRGSAANNPEPPISHHWFDSTHITYGVVTAGISAPSFQLEASAFRGAEPDERRWNIETPKLDSWSVRGTLTPSPYWAFQVSYGYIKQPEALHAGEDEGRFTASAHYDNSRLSGMLAFSAKNRMPGDTLTAWLAEADYKLGGNVTLFSRFENVANDELFPDHVHPLHDQAFRISKFQLGAAYDIQLNKWSSLTIGGSASLYAAPSVLDAYYGKTPAGFTIFMRINFGH